MASGWFAFFGRDWLASTLGWSAEERGHYITLLITQWEQDGLPSELERLELISPGVGRCWQHLAPKFPAGLDGRLRNARLEHERHLAAERSEKARASAARRWASRASLDTAQVAHMPEQCERICPEDAAMSMSYSPPPPPSPPPDAGASEGAPDGWQRLRAAWNATWGERRRWRSIEPPPEAVARLAEPGWLEEAIAAIPQIKAGLCDGFDTPPTLRQFCSRDDRGTFVARMLGGEFSDKRRGSPASRREAAQ